MQLEHHHRYPHYQQPEPSAPAISQPPALAPGATLAGGRYLIQGYIGGGGFGHIYRAQDTMLRHCRALKEAFGSDLHARRQFQLEAEFLLNVRHPNLVSAYAVFEESNRLYLVMDYVDGLTLEDIAIEHIHKTGRPLDEAQVLDWMIPICDAASALHQQPVPIIHRDIKPANIKLSVSTGEPVLMDLGLAKLYARGTQTIGAALAFTPGYAPPEQYQAVGATDQRTDVYGLGASLYYLLTGYQPTEAPARLSAHALRAPIALNALISRRTDAIVLRAMELDPAARQQSAPELAEALTTARRALRPQRARTADTASAHRMEPPQRTNSGGWYCTSCGTKNRVDGRFCQMCGKPGPDQAIPDGASPERIEVSAEYVAPTLADSTPTTPAPHRVVLPPRAPEPSSAPTPLYFPVSSSPGLSPVAPVAARMPWSRTTYEPATQREAWVSIFAFLAVVCLAISMTGIFMQPMLLFAVPAIALGFWCLRQRQISTEFRWLAAGALAIGASWLLFWAVILAMSHL